MPTTSPSSASTRTLAAQLGPFVSTDAQGDWWGGAGRRHGGARGHRLLLRRHGRSDDGLCRDASRLSIPRIALVDFNNDCVTDSLAYARSHVSPIPRTDGSGDETEAIKYRLYGVRLDTSGSVRDVSVPPLGDAGA